MTTADTLDDPAAAGRLQRPEDQRVTVVDRGTREILLQPPPAEPLPQRLVEMCRFANGEIPANRFRHLVVRERFPPLRLEVLAFVDDEGVETPVATPR